MTITKKNTFVSFILCFFFQIGIFAAKPVKYPVSDIADSLKEKANAVVRLNKNVFTVHSIEKASYYSKKVITILNDNAENLMNFAQKYDMYSKILYIKGVVYDAEGIVINTIKKKQIQDQSITKYSLYSDARVQFVNLNYDDFPLTVEYEFEIELDGFLSPYSNYFSYGYDIAIEKSQYKLSVPSDYKFKYKQNNFIDSAEVNEIEGNKEYFWQLNNIKSIEKEPYSPRFKDIVPNLSFAADTFYYGGYYGSFNSWNSFGSWQNQLLEDRQELPFTTVDSIKSLTEQYTDTIEKVKAVFNYLQSKTRYISIQLGIGGLQPFSAQEVDEVGYGDCKALSNYTMALLKSIGVDSYYTKIHSGTSSPTINPDFPETFSNHVILMVPLISDTLWLECTSQKLPFAYVHDKIAGRNALVISEKGGELKHLPTVNDEENTQVRNADVNILSNGNGRASITTVYKGFQFDNVFGLKDLDTDRQKKWLHRNIDIGSFSINDFYFEEYKDRHPMAIETLELSLNNYVSVSGRRIFLPLNLMNKQSYIPRELDKRMTNVVRNYGYHDIDSITYKIPEGYKVENIPDGLSITTQFGEYSMDLILSEGQITYVREILFKKGTYEPEKYNDFIAFYKVIERADRAKAVLVKE